MALDRGFYIFGEVSVHDCGRVFGQQRDALGNRPARRRWSMDYSYRQLAVLDDNFSTGAHAGQQPGEIAGRFRLRDVDYTVSHKGIIPWGRN